MQEISEGIQVTPDDHLREQLNCVLHFVDISDEHRDHNHCQDEVESNLLVVLDLCAMHSIVKFVALVVQLLIVLHELLHIVRFEIFGQGPVTASFQSPPLLQS